MPRALPKRRNLLTAVGALQGPPSRCQAGHWLTWLLAGDEPVGDGTTLAYCECATRHENGREHNFSSPNLWRYVPADGGFPARLLPVFPSTNRLAFALALQLYDAVRDRQHMQTAMALTSSESLILPLSRG